MKNWEQERNKIIGLGEFSAHKSYYPELQLKLEELELAYKNSENILASMSDAVIIHSGKGDFLYLNKTASEMLGINQNETTAYNYSDVVMPDYPTHSLYEVFQDISEGDNGIIQCSIQHLTSKKQLPVEISTSSISWHGEKAFVSVVRDFTVHKEYEASIIEAKKKAEENDKLKSAFLANMSYEIRTPMNGIIGFVDLLQTPDLSSEKSNTYLTVLTKSCDRLLNTINDIMEVSTIESGQTSLYLTDQNINDILTQQYNFFEPEALKRQTKLILTTPASETIVKTDRVKFESIISNLIKNAVKFTKDGEIEISYQIENMQLKFCVRDTGIGIAEDRQKAIFERFIQADMKISSGYEGTGLGLSICKSYVELLGGKIWVESEENKGSSFIFTLPYQH